VQQAGFDQSLVADTSNCYNEHITYQVSK